MTDIYIYIMYINNYKYKKINTFSRNLVVENNFKNVPFGGRPLPGQFTFFRRLFRIDWQFYIYFFHDGSKFKRQVEGKKKKEKRKNDYPKIITDRKKKKRDENVNIDPLIKCLENTFGKFEINIRTQWNEKKKCI